MKKLLLLTISIACLTSCAGKKPIDRFADEQTKKIHAAEAYIDADFDFWSAVYEPTVEDLEHMRATWIENGSAFPESKTFADVEREVQKSSQKMVLVSLFMTEYDKADLKDASLGWSISPIPQNVKELSETDLVLRTLMPVKNQWARLFLLRYTPEALSAVSDFVISNRTSSIRLKR